MRRPFSLFVGLRFSLAKKHNFLLSFVSLASMLGISFGVLILIVATSVINGSINVMRTEALKSVPHAVLQAEVLNGNWEEHIDQISNLEKISAAAPFLEGDAVIRNQGNFEFVEVRGILPRREQNVVENMSHAYMQILKELEATDQGIILGTRLAASLGVFNSGSIEVASLGNLLKQNFNDAQSFKVLGFADFGLYGNSNLALINLDDAQVLFEKDSEIDLQLRLKVEDIFDAKLIADRSKVIIPSINTVSWDEAQSSLFTALNLEKILTGIMLAMIIVIGAVNIISTLVMVVSNKNSDIAILRTLGASRSMILKIFVIQGMISGILGTLFGVILGIVCAVYAPYISGAIESVLNEFLVNGNVYFISHLRTQVMLEEIFLIGFVAILISFLATLYPAYRATKIYPAEVLRYE